MEDQVLLIEGSRSKAFAHQEPEAGLLIIEDQKPFFCSSRTSG